MYELDFALSNLQWLICHKTKPNLETNFDLDLQICVTWVDEC